MIPWQAVGATARRPAILRRAPVAAVCLFVAWLLPLPAATQGVPTGEVDVMLGRAVVFAESGDLDRTEEILFAALARWPDHPGILEGLAGLRLRQDRPAEAEALAAHRVTIHPGSDYAWELLAASRYLQDDAHGALRAWSHGRRPVVREMEILVLGHDGPRAADARSPPVRLTGLAPGQPLTVEGLVRGERRLDALPAAASARLGYRALSGGGATLQGTVVLLPDNPFTLPALVGHAVRVLNRRVRVVSADPLGRLERWELSGNLEGTLRAAAFTLAHPAPRGLGVWRWTADHDVGRYAPVDGDRVVREERGGVGWSHSDWVSATLRGSIHGRIDVRPGRGTFAGAGMGWTLLPLSERASIRAEGMGWTKVGEALGGAGPSEEATRFGRLAFGASLHPAVSSGAAAPSGVALRAGAVTVSPGAPHDLLPRIGAGKNTSLLMRARSDLDGEGVVRRLFPGRTWVHGGVEVLRAVGSVGPVGIGVATFADGIQVLGAVPGSADHAGRGGAVHLGVGMRARIPGVTGWLRADWGMDPADGASTISASWVSGGAP